MDRRADIEAGEGERLVLESLGRPDRVLRGPLLATVPMRKQAAHLFHVVGGACVPQLIHIRHKSTRCLIQNCFCKIPITAEPAEPPCPKLVAPSQPEHAMVCSHSQRL